MSGRSGVPRPALACLAATSIGTMPAGVGGAVSRVIAGALVALVHLWQLLLRPVLGNNCRFEPGCSDYALEALRRHGAGRGGALAVTRVLRCHPFCAGGHDPVPPAPSATAGSHRKPR